MINELKTNQTAPSPWGPLAVADSHVHFLSGRLLSMLASQAKVGIEAAAQQLGWTGTPEDPAQLAEIWVKELDRYGIGKAALIASLPGDEGSVVCAVARFPDRFRGFMMVNPLGERAAENAAGVLVGGHMQGVCLFPAMHRYSLHDARALAVIEAAASCPSTVVFVHCGVLSVGFRTKLALPSEFDMRYSNPLDLHAIALRYSAVKFVIPHFGAGMFREALMLAELCPNVYLDTSSTNRWMRYEGAHFDLREVFRRALEIVGPRRLLFGTDSSFFPRGWHHAIYDAQSKALYEIGTQREDAALIFGGNFAEIFPI